MKPDEIAKLTKFLRAKFELPSISVRKRPQKNDSAEVYIGEEFVGRHLPRRGGWRTLLQLLHGHPRD